MTLSDLLSGSQASPEELADNLKYKSIKNSIVDQTASFKRNFMESMQFVVNDIVEGRIYNSCCYDPANKVEVPEEDKKELIKVMGEKAFSTLEEFKNNIATLFDEEEKEKPEETKVEIKLEPQPVAQAIVPAVKNMFGY